MRSMSYSLVFTLLCAGSLAAQPFTRSVQGVVTDQHSRPLDHAVVQIENEWTLAIRSYVTHADGEYHFAELSRDRDYRLTAEPGHVTLEIGGFYGAIANLGRNAHQNLAITSCMPVAPQLLRFQNGNCARKFFRSLGLLDPKTVLILGPINQIRRYNLRNAAGTACSVSGIEITWADRGWGLN